MSLGLPLPDSDGNYTSCNCGNSLRWHDDQFPTLEMSVWVVLPGKLPRPAEVLAERVGDLEWIEKEGDDDWHGASGLPATRETILTRASFPRKRV